MKAASLKRMHAVQSQLCDILEKPTLRRQQMVGGGRGPGAGRDERTEHQGFGRQRRYDTITVGTRRHTSVQTAGRAAPTVPPTSAADAGWCCSCGRCTRAGRGGMGSFFTFFLHNFVLNLKLLFKKFMNLKTT